MSDLPPPEPGSGSAGSSGSGATGPEPHFPSRRSLRAGQHDRVSRASRRSAGRSAQGVPTVPESATPIRPLPPEASAAEPHGQLPDTGVADAISQHGSSGTDGVVPAADRLPLELTAEKPAKRTPSAGRDLPAAIAVGLTMLVVVLVGLLIYQLAFVVIVTVFAGFGVWEFSRALLQRGIGVPILPVMIGTVAMPASAYFSGAEGLLFALVASATAVLLWRCLDPAEGAIQSVFAGVFALAWIPFFISFVFLLLRGADGPTTGITLDLSRPRTGALQVAIMLMLVVANDTCGYLVGVFFGKHPMAPKISPKKSWEGFAGSAGGAIVLAVPATVFLLNDPWWVGMVLALSMVTAATAGDFAESMIKRELGVKDMSSILPGHGGVMDRLDSILFAAPAAFIVFTLLGR
ncbi:phosphatidate cytidylyltransferase [Paeniglutamicibacter antarcticus]|uniref:Phosphatidate cytidylyltransferase n=1 Tax=Arthrobacter terrae TaxID=2935737 RepID=A0A931G570_9MICC|nr:phosphatidate cytidylyltransferase [Arthrobacter terrae]